MRLFSIKYLSLLMLLIASSGSIQATYETDGDDCCRTSCYDCSCEPLYCGSWALQIDGGVRPIIWHGRKDFFSLQNANGVSGVTVLADLPKFHSLYHVPWQIGGQVSYAFSTNANVYIEVNYAQARGKQNGTAITGSNLFINLDKYKLVDAYVGAHYYFNRWCDRVALFVGAKIGLIHHKRIDFLSSLTGIACCCGFTPERFFKSNTSIAGGANIGLDICFCGNWSFVITGEVVACRGPRSVGTLVLSAQDSANLNGATALILDRINTEIAFPVTFGIKYTF